MKKIITVVVSLVISLVLVEIILKVTGFKPWESVVFENPGIFKSDPVLGWKATKGSFEINPSNSKGEKTLMNFGENGDRRTGQKKKENSQSVIIIGGSFAQGWGVNDDETFSYMFQKTNPKIEVYNFGQSGYGGVQSLLLLKKEIKKINNTKLVIYGFIEHHEYRNVARSAWLRTLAKYSSRGYSDSPSVPFGTINSENNLVINEPISYIKLPFREISSLVTLVEKVYMKLKIKKRKKIQKLVTEKTILEMKKTAESNNSEFILLMLEWTNNYAKENYENFLKENKIKYVNCAFKLDSSTLVPGDYHPNKKGHEIYNKCLNSYVKAGGFLNF